MKINIIGFNQQMLCDLGLKVDHALILRWFMDFYYTGKMKVFKHQGLEYFWVHYDTLIQEFPILKIWNKRTMAEKMDRLVSSGVLEKHVVRNHGTYTCFRPKMSLIEAMEFKSYKEQPKTQGVKGGAKGDDEDKGQGSAGKTATKDYSIKPFY